MLFAQSTPFLALDPLASSSSDALRYPDTTDSTYPSMYNAYADRSESSSRRHSPSTSGSNTPNSYSAPSMTLGRNPFSSDKVSLPPIGSMFTANPGDDIYERRNSLPYPSANRIPSGAAQWLPGLGMHDDGLRPRATGSGASTGSPNSPASSSPSFTNGYASSSTAPTTVKSSPGTSPFSDRLSLPAAPSTTGREWSAPVTIPVPPSDNNTISSGPSASPTPLSDSPPATTAAAAPPARRRGKLPKHVTETLRTWLLSHADHPYPTEEEKKMLCNVTSLTLSQVSNWMINARRRILVPASKQQAALNATTGPYLGMARSSAATDLARQNRQGMTIPHTLSSHALPHSHSDPYGGAYTLPPHLSPAGDLHLSARSSYPSLATGGRPNYTYPPPNIQNYYGNGLSSVTAGLASYNAGLVQGGSDRYYGQEHHSYSATH